MRTKQLACLLLAIVFMLFFTGCMGRSYDEFGRINGGGHPPHLSIFHVIFTLPFLGVCIWALVLGIIKICRRRDLRLPHEGSGYVQWVIIAMLGVVLLLPVALCAIEISLPDHDELGGLDYPVWHSREMDRMPWFVSEMEVMTVDFEVLAKLDEFPLLERVKFQRPISDYTREFLEGRHPDIDFTDSQSIDLSRWIAVANYYHENGRGDLAREIEANIFIRRIHSESDFAEINQYFIDQGRPDMTFGLQLEAVERNFSLRNVQRFLDTMEEAAPDKPRSYWIDEGKKRYLAQPVIYLAEALEHDDPRDIENGLEAYLGKLTSVYDFPLSPYMRDTERTSLWSQSEWPVYKNLVEIRMKEMDEKDLHLLIEDLEGAMVALEPHFQTLRYIGLEIANLLLVAQQTGFRSQDAPSEAIAAGNVRARLWRARHNWAQGNIDDARNELAQAERAARYRSCSVNPSQERRLLSNTKQALK